MQRFIFFIGLVFLTIGIKAQPPQLIPYQAIARDNAGNPVLNQNIGLRFSIHDQTISGAVVWQESQTVVSNNLGIIVTALGGTTQLTSVDWGSGAKFLQVEMDITGGMNYLDMGTQQMMSVPYALYAENSGNPGNPGNPGMNSLISTLAEPAGGNCANGGVKIIHGLDQNQNNILDPNEIDLSNVSYVCNGTGNSINNLTVGSSYGGGLVLYIDETGQHGIIAANQDYNYSSTSWCNSVYAGTTSTSVGSGKHNTKWLSEFCTGNGLVDEIMNLTLNGYSDWFIPSKDELMLMQLNLANNNLGNLNGTYMSSSYHFQYRDCTIMEYAGLWCLGITPGSLDAYTSIYASINGGPGPGASGMGCTWNQVTLHKMRPIRYF